MVLRIRRGTVVGRHSQKRERSSRNSCPNHRPLFLLRSWETVHLAPTRSPAPLAIRQAPPESAAPPNRPVSTILPVFLGVEFGIIAVVRRRHCFTCRRTALCRSKWIPTTSPLSQYLLRRTNARHRVAVIDDETKSPGNELSPTPVLLGCRDLLILPH